MEYSFHSTALKPPKLSWQPENEGSIVIHEEQDSSIQLRCHLQQGNPKPKFSWFKDDKPLYPKENWLTSPSCDHLKEGVYYFTNGSNQDVIICGAPIKYEKFAGKYTCRADNEQGYDKIDVTLNILGRIDMGLNTLTSLTSPDTLTSREALKNSIE